MNKKIRIMFIVGGVVIFFLFMIWIKQKNIISNDKSIQANALDNSSIETESSNIVERIEDSYVNSAVSEDNVLLFSISKNMIDLGRDPYTVVRDAEYPLQHYQYASRSTTRPDAVIFYPNTTKEEVKYLFPIDFNYTYNEEDKAFSEINDISLYASEELYPDYFNEHRYINVGGGDCVEYYPNVDSGKYRYVPYYAFEEGENIGNKNENFLPQYGDNKELSFDETILNAGFTEEELYKILTTDWDFIKRKFKFVIEPNPSGVLLRYYYRYVWRNSEISIYIDLNDERGMYIITSDGTCIDTHRGGTWGVVIE